MVRIWIVCDGGDSWYGNDDWLLEVLKLQFNWTLANANILDIKF